MTDDNFEDLPWAEIKEISERGLFERVFKKIPKTRFQFATKDENREILINSALKSLQKSNQGATREQAVILADLMINFAWRVLGERNSF